MDQPTRPPTVVDDQLVDDQRWGTNGWLTPSTPAIARVVRKVSCTPL
jgi:hypothetical protein